MRRLGVASLLMASAAMGCAPHRLPAQGPRSGYLVVYAPTARAYHLPDSVRLPELARSDVPRTVIAAADAFSTRYRNEGVWWDPECSRFFQAPDRYVVLLQVACRSSLPSRPTHPWDLAVFLSDGAEVPPLRGMVGSAQRFDVVPRFVEGAHPRSP